MIKSELIQKIAAANPHLYHRDVERIVNVIFDEIIEALSRGERVELRGFGAFHRVQDRIMAFPREGLGSAALERAGYEEKVMRKAGDPVTAIFLQVIERLRRDFDPSIVDAVLTHFSAARRGLSEAELDDLVGSMGRADQLYPVLRQLRPYLKRGPT